MIYMTNLDVPYLTALGKALETGVATIERRSIQKVTSFKMHNFAVRYFNFCNNILY